MASTRRKAAAAGLAVIGIAGLSLAAAAQLNITSDTLGAGTQTVAACDTDGIAVDYTVVGDDVTEVLLSGVAGACAGDTFSIQLTGPTAGAPLGTAVAGTLSLTGTDDARTATIPLGVGNAQPVVSVTGIAIVIS